MALCFVFNIDKNNIQIYNNKDIDHFSQNLINISLKYGHFISKFEKHYLVLEVIILDPKNYHLIVIFLDSYLIVNIHKIILD